MIKAPMLRNTGLLATCHRVSSAVVLSSILMLLTSGSAFADRNGGQGNGNSHGNQGQRGWHGDHGPRGWHGDRQGNRYQPGYRYPYAQPVYVPPPVYYEPRQSPGISLFFPLDLRR
jgi:hypothetical protein